MENNNFNHQEILDFKNISYQLGSNLSLVQAAGGNTSMKSNDSMLIKASGTWLSNSLKEDVFVEVDLNSIKKKINNKQDDNFSEDIISKNDLRPSTETSFHALIDFKYVLHVHSTSTIANAISFNSATNLTKQLGDNFAFIPYIRPGFPLTMSMKNIITPGIQIIILENHGLIVAGDDLEKTYDLLLNTHKKLDVIINYNFSFGKESTSKDVDEYQLKNDEKYNFFKTTDEKFFSAFSKSFYPDHVIFLGPGVPTFENAQEAVNFLNKLKDKNLNLPPYIILKGVGLYEQNSAIPAAKEMIDCFLEVLLRTNFDEELKPLSESQENDLLNWDAEIYRQSIN
jgi:rhamnose utilization protein RhaD (predicted bifunctional aldolase and dehydrogenase)